MFSIARLNPYQYIKGREFYLIGAGGLACAATTIALTCLLIATPPPFSLRSITMFAMVGSVDAVGISSILLGLILLSRSHNKMIEQELEKAKAEPLRIKTITPSESLPSAKDYLESFEIAVKDVLNSTGFLLAALLEKSGEVPKNVDEAWQELRSQIEGIFSDPEEVLALIFGSYASRLIDPNKIDLKAKNTRAFLARLPDSIEDDGKPETAAAKQILQVITHDPVCDNLLDKKVAALKKALTRLQKTKNEAAHEQYLSCLSQLINVLYSRAKLPQEHLPNWCDCLIPCILENDKSCVSDFFAKIQRKLEKLPENLFGKEGFFNSKLKWVAMKGANNLKEGYRKNLVRSYTRIDESGLSKQRKEGLVNALDDLLVIGIPLAQALFNSKGALRRAVEPIVLNKRTFPAQAPTSWRDGRSVYLKKLNKMKEALLPTIN